MTQEQTDFCFCTLALGKTYRLLALELAKDLGKYSPNTSFLVLTDKPSEFNDQKNILAFQHKQVLYYDNDKKFLIKKALSLFNSCICIDADMRILAAVPQELKWLPGITARSCSSLLEHHQGIIHSNDQPNLKRVRILEVIKKLAQNLNLDLENVKWIHEFLFVVANSSGKEIDFLKWFEMISRHLELNGVSIGPGSAMGLAAAKVGLPVRQDTMEGISFFDDRIERVRISKGQADPNEKLMYFEKLKTLKYPKRQPLEKLAVKLGKKIGHLDRSVRLRLDTLRNFDFYYR